MANKQGRGVNGRRVTVRGFRRTWYVAEVGDDWLHLRPVGEGPGHPGHTFNRGLVKFVRGNYEARP